MSAQHETPTTNAFEELLDVFTGLGILLLPLNIFAIPALVLLLPLAVMVLPFAILAAPFLLIRYVRVRNRRGWA